MKPINDLLNSQSTNLGIRKDIMELLSDEFQNRDIQSHHMENKNLQSLLNQELSVEINQLSIDEHPYQSEEKLYSKLMQMEISNFWLTVDNNQILTYLKDKYGKKLSNIDYIRYKRNQITQPTELEHLKNYLMTRWKTYLHEKIIRWELEQLQQWRDELIAKFIDKLNLYKSIKYNMKMNDDQLGRLWNDAKGNWTVSNIDVLNEFQYIFDQDKNLQYIVDILGRGTPVVTNNKQIENNPSDNFWSGNSGKEEFIGVHPSDDINFLLSSEIGLLTSKTMEMLFYVKLVEKQLQTFDISGTSIKSTSNSQMKPKESQYGPIIICIDTSGSMKGAPEKLAKSLTFGICRKALGQKRPCYIISFSTNVISMEIRDISDIDQLLEFLKFSFNGGTSFDSPLQEALIKLQSDDTFGKSDILVISDFVLGTLSNYTTYTLQKILSQDVELHSLIISSQNNHQLLSNFTHNWRYDLKNGEILKITQ